MTLTLNSRVGVDGKSQGLEGEGLEASESEANVVCGFHAGLLGQLENVRDALPCARLKLDELAFHFLAKESSQVLINGFIADFEAGLELPENPVGVSLSSPVFSPRRFSPSRGGSLQASSPPRSPRSPGRHGFSPRSPISHSTRKTLLESKTISSPPAPVVESEKKKLKETFQISRFYGPGCKRKRSSGTHSIEGIPIKEIDRFFDRHEDGILMNDFVVVCKELCGMPTFFNGPLVHRILLIWKLTKNEDTAENGEHEEEEKQQVVEEENIKITKEQFCHFWGVEMEPYDELDRLFRLLKQPDADTIVGSDFAPYLEELLAYHPGLEFLETTPEFQEKYARTVVARILYQVNTAWNGKISRRELRRSDLLKVCHQVDEEEDINLVHRYFSYEHFYVLYCKFWELDSDHDFLLSRDDLMRHGGHSLTPKIVDRIFQQVVYPFMSGDPERMGFEDFVFFFLAEEDKTNPISLRYWFRCVDLDDDGVIRPWEMKYFYNQQLSRLQSYGHEVISFADVLCQAHDFVHPAEEGHFRLPDFVDHKCIRISGMLFNVLFNLNKFIAFEQRDPYLIRQQHENPDLTDWDRYAAIEYARLASAEEEREIEEENLVNWNHSDSHGRQQQSWLQYNESPF
uniref:Calmodulin n=1 Tax=Mucochytrium quahogii TaxID=96639 RepID=A0A7S2S6E6_9STRA|mmetsp:Transcript_6147/g.9608  ORF Transcript_6147/g.9608 Transcript_6147/m.9608 type:complete len:629 (+) Transcript_6147:221-2107(+)|eukprot:CAMPEP_0203756308 /NCGR_PEP_ID=MMETSP0098-20131031/9602_1 /ASSEMBLY_ACC=CAM_ASM_000208 /TAXON_ID=96639 /ORGANISM=" , Strain NY0313808BC1" /LENGTH=628 /DNA_ID=CAMNT_0050648137 /DNA_START=214 /DNA_END=2100 /DNA_ORIENTATION=-